MTKFSVIVFFAGYLILAADGRGSRNVRLVFDNPADMSTYLGYKDHHIQDMASLVNEAKINAHGQSSTGSGAPYNIPNFPGQTGSTGNVASAKHASSLSFAGTNLWRCDAHVVDVCDLNCLDVDPKDGCPFCLQSCQTALHGQGAASGSSSSSGSHSGSTSASGSTSGTSGFAGTGAQSGMNQAGSPYQQPSSGSGAQTSVSQSASPYQQPSSGAGAGTQSGSGQSATANQQPSGLSGTGTQSGSSQSGSISQQPSGLTGTGSGSSQYGQLPSGLVGTGTQSGTSQTGSIVQQPSGLTGTGSQSAGQGTAGSAGAQTTGKPVCPYYPPNCPAVYTKLENGCLVCTIVQQAGIATNPPTITAPPVTTQGPTCPPTRCVSPCNVGIMVGADGCPHCKCPDHV